MPELQHARSKMREVPATDKRLWVHQDPPNLGFRLSVRGMMTPLGWADFIEMWPGLVSTLGNGETFEWEAVHIGGVRVSHPAHLMLIEGAAPAWFFMGCVIQSVTREELYFEGPFFLLQMQAPAIYEVPFVLKNITLGMLQNPPKGAKLADLVPAMAVTLLNQS